MRKKPASADAMLAVPVPADLMEQIEYMADQDGVSVAVVVNSMLEEIVEIERVRRMSDEQARLEQAALFGSRGSKARRRAQREAAAAREAEMAAWRATRKHT